MSGAGYRNAPPRAAAMVEALRGLGYTTETALADLIDNSISAGAKTIGIDFHWAGSDSRIAILDDGTGMTDLALDKAMRLGDKNPLHDRDPSDLGRFGLGLKTASFSQARRLTVFSRRDGELSCLRWDLDVLAADASGDWRLLEGAHPGSEPYLAPVAGREHGTLVLWEVLDRVVSKSFAERDMHELIDRVERHLSMVFHRYLDGSGPQVDILINSRKLKAWDPFLSRHPATWRSPEAPIGHGDGKVTAQSFVLPHKDRLTNKEYIDAGGPDGWSSQQGFYIYRGRRLLVAGSWLGLGRGRAWSKDEAHRLARLRLDIPNLSDSDWKLDIRKSSAHPPVWLRGQLTRLAEEARDRARRVYLNRAQGSSTGKGEELNPVWSSTEGASGRRYRVNRDHPAVKSLFEESEGIRNRVDAMLRVLEETIPVQRIWLEAAESGEHAKGSFTGEPDEAVISVLNVLYRNLVTRKGMSPQMAKMTLLRTEPFDLHPDLVNGLPELIDGASV